MAQIFIQAIWLFLIHITTNTMAWHQNMSYYRYLNLKLIYSPCVT